MPRAGLLENKVTFITGGASGIGRATALRAAEEGALVAVADVSEAGGAETASTIGKAGGKAISVPIDIARPDSVKAAIDAVMRQYGRLDCAFNNAGVFEGEENSWVEETFDRIVGVNLKGAMLCLKYELEHMSAARKGAIVNTSSILGVVASGQNPGYVASKHGVIGLTKTAALQYAATGIRVNAVCPGTVRTPMLQSVIDADPARAELLKAASPINRIAEPEEIAEAALWLLSDRASYVTGHALLVDGGLFAR